MTFLPIVDRELGVAARKRSTFWLRVVAAFVALVIGSGFLTISMVSGIGSASLGKGLFGVLTWLSLAAALCAGLFFTSDCLSEEKREGTLGFLFLTDLRGYDVVLGKLLATSLRGCFALLAIFPILAVTMLMGGVTGPQFWKTILALANALFFSLAGGMFVSAISRDSQKAMAGTLFLLLLVLVGAPAIDGAIAAAKGRRFAPGFILSSPGYVFMAAGRWGDPAFWRGLAANQFVAWVLLGLACVLVPRTWQQRGAKSSGSQKSWAYAWRYGGVKRRAALRQKLLSRNPVLWLACRERWQAVAIWAPTILVLGGFITLLASDFPSMMWMLWGYVGGALTLIFYLGTASQSSRFFLDARRSGLVELLLAAPLNGREIVQGQWRALLRMFGLPVALLLCVQIAASTLSQQATWGTMSAGGGPGPNLAAIVVAGLTSAIVTAANLIALCWVGMWMGMTSKSANLATLKTLVFVQVIPWFIITFASAMVIPLLLMPAMMNATSTPGTTVAITNRAAWIPILYSAVGFILSLGKDFFFWTLARRKLYSNFRAMAVQAVAPIQFPVRPPVRQPLTTPPVIPTKL